MLYVSCSLHFFGTAGGGGYSTFSIAQVMENRKPITQCLWSLCGTKTRGKFHPMPRGIVKMIPAWLSLRCIETCCNVLLKKKKKTRTRKENKETHQWVSLPIVLQRGRRRSSRRWRRRLRRAGPCPRCSWSQVWGRCARQAHHAPRPYTWWPRVGLQQDGPWPLNSTRPFFFFLN